MSHPANLPDAILEIDRLRIALAEAQRVRDAYWEIVTKMLPTAPPEFELNDEEFSSAMENGQSAAEFLAELFHHRGAA
jgi:hypothetical protein